MSRERRSENLGGMGESFFRLLAKDAQLVVNPSSDDQAGWDFVVEDSSPLAINYGNYSRAAYRIQVKATMGDSLSVQMSYSSLLSLIQYGGPTFVFLLRFKDGLSPVSMHAVHLGKLESIEILRSLRQRDVSQKDLKINKAKYSLRFDKGVAIAGLSGSGLRNYLESMLGESYVNYVGNKAKWIKDIQREGGSLRANMQFKSEQDFRAMVDCLLGYEAEFNVDSRIYKAPFGIADTEPISSSSNMPTTIRPLPDRLMRGVLRLRTSPYGAVYQFKTTMYAAPPSIPKEFAAVRFKTSLFDVLYRFDDQSFEINESDIFSYESLVGIDEVRGFVRYMGEAVNAQNTYIEVVLDGDEGSPLRLTVDADVTVPENYDAISAVAEILYLRLVALGLGEELVRLGDVFDVSRTGFLSHVGDNYSPKFSFEFAARPTVDADPDAVIFSFCVRLQKKVLVCYAAFHGEVARVDEEKMYGEFYRSEYLGEILVPEGDDVDAAVMAYGASLKDRLLARGVTAI
ncbi:hypothetical protein [Pseudomonas sp. CAM1A]|uniref:hypothetical protein n=1 Tax=Pseudomonas sp. CAM1A TaxID=3231717 RepID=UPI0039C5D2B8